MSLNSVPNCNSGKSTDRKSRTVGKSPVEPGKYVLNCLDLDVEQLRMILAKCGVNLLCIRDPELEVLLDKQHVDCGLRWGQFRGIWQSQGELPGEAFGQRRVYLVGFSGLRCTR